MYWPFKLIVRCSFPLLNKFWTMYRTLSSLWWLPLVNKSVTIRLVSFIEWSTINGVLCVPSSFSQVFSQASARPPEFRSDRQPNRLATAVASPNVFARERPNTVAGNEFTKTPRSRGDVRSNFNEVAGIKPVVTQRYCGELVSKNRCGELRQKPNYPFVAPSSVVDKQPRVCNQRQQEREMRQSFAHSRYCHDISVPSAMSHSPNCINNTDQFASQSSEVKKAVGRAESAPFVNNA